MASEFGAVTDWINKVEKVTDPAVTKRCLSKAGQAGKKSALGAASDALGGDRKFSGWPGKPALSAGYDEAGDSSVDINFRPAGMWRLAEEGRKASGTIYPKSGRRKGGGAVYGRALRTPDGPRAASSFSRSRGTKAYTAAVKDASKTVPEAYHDQFVDEIRRVL
jgi:hypothetical protein